MLDLRKAFLAVLLIPALIPPSVPGQSRASTSVPDQFEFIEGRAYMGSDSVEWKDGRLVFVKRTTDMSGKGSFDEKVETLKPTPEAWERLWKRIDALGVWEWKPDFHDTKRDGPDGNSWALTLQHGAK